MPGVFVLDLERENIAEILEAIFELYDRLGIHEAWGSAHGSCLQLVFPEDVDDGLVVQILESKARAKASARKGDSHGS